MSGRPRPGILHAPVEAPDGHKVSIVVVNWNGRAFLERALASIVEHTRHEPHELIVIDNGSTDGSTELLRRFRAPGAARLEVVCNPTNRFFSAAFNQGFNLAAPDSRYVMVFCNDVEAKERGWLADFVEAIQAPGTIAAGHAVRQPLAAEHRELLCEQSPDYRDPSLGERMRAAATDPELRYRHISGYCFLLDRALLRRTGLYLEGGAFRQYHSDWELYLRFHVLGLGVASFQPRVHHWHGISELVAEHPHRYRELVERLDDPATVERYLQEGRPLFEEESAYRAWRAQRREGS